MESAPIRIGNQTSRSAPWDVAFKYAAQNGFDAFEWLSDNGAGGGWHESDMHPDIIQHVTSIARECDISFSIHAPWRSNPVSPDGRAAIEQSIDLAYWIRARLVNLHLWTEGGIECFAQALTPLIEMARRSNIRLSVENTPQTTPEHFNKLFRILGGMARTRGQVGMCLDMGHANLCGETRNNYLDFVDRLDASVPITHVHAHENWGDYDSHLTLFTGPSASSEAGIRGLVQRLRIRRFAGSIIMEQWPSPPSQLFDARERLKRLFAGS